jgi:hypothetical protein
LYRNTAVAVASLCDAEENNLTVVGPRMCRRESLAPSHDFSGGRFLDDEDEEDVSVLGMEVFGILCAKSKCNNGPKDMLKAPSRLGNPLIKDRAFREVRMDKDFEASFMMSNQSQWPLSTSSLSSH